MLGGSRVPGRARTIAAALAAAMLMTVQAGAQQKPVPAVPAVPEIDLKLFNTQEVDRSKGCSVALWQADRDPAKDRFAYVFTEVLAPRTHARQPARIRIGTETVTLTRVAKGGKTNGYDLYEHQLYRLPGENEYAILDLKLGELEGEAVAVEGGSMTVVMRGKQVFRVAVRGGAGCNTPAAAAEPESLAGIFRRYDVKPPQVQRAFVQSVQKKCGCSAEVMKSGIVGFQMSEESAIWQIPCERFAYQASAVFALVYLPDPATQHTFLEFKGPKGRERTSPAGVLMDPEWNLRTRTVRSVALGRAAGDCGVLERHKVAADGSFTLVEYREKKSCDGKETKPEDFPLVYRAP